MSINRIIIGTQWGNEGKGKVVDFYSSQAEYIVRYPGDSNTHHFIPKGALQSEKTWLIGNGAVIDPIVFLNKISLLNAASVFSSAPHETIRVSERAHLIFSYHRKLDQLRKERDSRDNIETTMLGVGPAYEDKAAHRGIQVIDLLHPKRLYEKLKIAIEEKNILFKYHFKADEIELEPLYSSCLQLGKQLEPFATDVQRVLTEALKQKRPLLFEGTQGTLLDVDHGTYPDVTCFNTVASHAFTASGLGVPAVAPQVIGIAKAYTTRVGRGPFPTEIEKTDSEIAQKICELGDEFDANQSKPRRVGWLDLVALKHATEVNGLTGLALMKADILQDFDYVKICTSYRLAGTTLYELPACFEDYKELEPAYEVLPGWTKLDPHQIHSRIDLPIELQTYIRVIEDFLGIPIILLSIGPQKEETLVL